MSKVEGSNKPDPKDLYETLKVKGVTPPQQVGDYHKETFEHVEEALQAKQDSVEIRATAQQIELAELQEQLEAVEGEQASLDSLHDSAESGQVGVDVRKLMGEASAKRQELLARIRELEKNKPK